MSADRNIVISGIAALLFVGSLPVLAQQTPPNPTDPFAGVAEHVETEARPPAAGSRLRNFFHENFGFRKEIMSQFTLDESGNAASRQSLGVEVLKKFSTRTSTVASFNFQGRVVRRDGFNPVQNDMEGENRGGWFFEYHNFYLDLYNVLNPALSDRQRSRNVGRFNFRAGRFYLPFGLNLQTDTHGTLLQLSNERNFGFERDWYTGFWGTLNRHLNYDAYYVVGSGYDLAYRGQRGLGALRVSLSQMYSSQYGLEGGVSFIAGERLSHMAPHRVIRTDRTGFDGRLRRPVPHGLLTFTTELSSGHDNAVGLFTQLSQADYLHASRRWGGATQYRRFRQEGGAADASLIGEVTWYFRNDVGNSNIHWLKLNVERRLDQIHGGAHTVIALQYYFYR